MAPSHYLRPLLAPDSVALVGASERPGSPGRVVYQNMLAGEFKGALYAVNPGHAKVLGRPAYASLAAIGRPIDLAVICAPPAAVPNVLKCERGLLRAAAILSGTPMATPTDDRRWRRELVANARASGVRILGPASFGVIRTSQGLNATLGAATALPGRLALLSQSGAMVGALLDFARSAGIGFASVAALGAGSDVDISELLEFALADIETEGIVLYIETVPDARRFMSALRAAARTKPVIVLKAGRHAAAAPGTPSSDRVFDAALKRAGTVRVATYTQLFGAARILALGRFPSGNRLAIVTNGRGPGLLVADRAAEVGVALASFTQATVAALKALSRSGSKLANPLDIQGDAPPERFAAALRAVLGDANVDAAVVLHVTTPVAGPVDSARAVAAEAEGATKPVLAALLGAVDRVEASAALEKGGIANFYTPENAVEAFSFLVAYRKNQEWLLEVPPPQPEFAAADLAAAERIRRQTRRSAGSALPPRQARTLLSAFGITVLPLAAPRTLQRARPMTRSIGATGGTAMEIRVHRDAVFGSVIALSLARSRGEPEVMLPPLNRRLAADLVASVCGVMPAAERHTLTALLLKVSTLVCALPWVIELELAPVLAAAGDAIVGGASVVADPKRHVLAHGYRHMAIHPYPVELETTVTLRDGSLLRVRPIRPEDAAAERAFVASLSDESRYLRFMHHLHELTPQMLARFTQVDYDRELALVALTGKPGAEQIVGVARYVANPDRESAEFAIVVADVWQGKGLGRALMGKLIASAKRRGFRRLVGAILGINASMQKLVRTLGFRLRTDPDDAEQLLTELELSSKRRRLNPD